jgi:MiaB/RimO family radical SAM methylthiotransferase
VTFARGHLRSYGIEEVVERARQDVSLGVRELWVTSQDTACYGKDKGTNLAELLNALCSIEDDFRIRVGMMTPNTVRDILDKLVEVFHDEHVFKFVHLPVQSGDDHVLKRMRRFYSVDDFKNIVTAFRVGFPMMTLSTDVICGFPGESEEAFKNTMQLIEEVKPDIVNVSKFFARPRTVAAEMQEDFVPLTEIRRRSNRVAALARKVAFERNQRWIGWTGEMVVDEVGKISGSWVGRNFAYKPIVVKSSCKLLGKTITVKVVRTFPTYLEGEMVE